MYIGIYKTGLCWYNIHGNQFCFDFASPFFVLGEYRKTKEAYKKSTKKGVPTPWAGVGAFFLFTFNFVCLSLCFSCKKNKPPE